MEKSQELPGFKRKRGVLFGAKTAPDEMRETGRRFFRAERFDDALEFFSRTEAADDVREVVRVAMERGDTALFLRAKVVLKEKPTEQELEALARKAEETGRKSMAALAWLKSGQQERAAQLRAEATGTALPPGSEEQAPSETKQDDKQPGS